MSTRGTLAVLRRRWKSLVAVTLLLSGRATRKTPVPFGPLLVLGALAVLAFDLVPPS